MPEPDPSPTPPEDGETLADGGPVKRYHLIFFQSGYKQDFYGDMNVLVYHRVREMLDEAITTSKDETEIDVWLESPGGDPNIAYKLFLDLQNRCRKLRGVVPDYAKSAATLFLLGTDEFYMGPAAELGPLDAQIEHPDREDKTVSALDVAKALGFLSDFAVDLIVNGGNKLLHSTGLSRTHVLREMDQFSAGFLRPVVAKFDPHLWHRAAKQLDVAQRYARIMLPLRRLPESDDETEDARDLVKHLIEQFPSHDFVISRREARALPLPVLDGEAYDRWKDVLVMHKLFHENIAGGDINSVFLVFDDEELEGFIEAIEARQGDDDEDTEDTTASPSSEGRTDETPSNQG